MPSVTNVARFEPLLPGTGKITLSRFNAQQSLGPNYATSIELIVVRKSEAHLESWNAPSPDGFITIVPKNARQHAQEFEFEVGPEVVNPMAYDTTGDYYLRIRNKDGIIISFILSVLGQARADTAYVQKTYAAPNNGPQGIPGGYVPPHTQASPDPNAPSPFAGMAAGGAAAGAAGAAGAGAAKSGSSLILKIILILVLLGIIGAGVTFYLGYWGDSLKALINGDGTQVEQVEEDLSLTEEDKQAAAEQAAEGEDATEGEDQAGQAGADQADQATDQASDAGNAAANAAADAAGMFDDEEDTGAIPVTPVPAPNASGASGTSGAPSAPAAMDAATACTLQNKQGSEQEILNNCLRAAPSAAQLDSFLKEALQTGRCEVATKILSAKGRAQNGGNYAFLYGLLSDPKAQVASNCIKKDEKEAQYWYGHAQRDPNFNNAEATKAVQFFLQ